MNEFNLGITVPNKYLYKILLEKEHAVPQDYLFCNTPYNQTGQKMWEIDDTRISLNRWFISFTFKIYFIFLTYKVK